MLEDQGEMLDSLSEELAEQRELLNSFGEEMTEQRDILNAILEKVSQWWASRAPMIIWIIFRVVRVIYSSLVTQ